MNTERLVAIVAILGAAGCPGNDEAAAVDAAAIDTAAVDAPAVDAPDVDAAVDAATDAAIDATIDAPPDAGWQDDCSLPLPCPPPSAGKATICGWIHDTEIDAVIADASPTRQACTGATTSGPCALRLRYFDALDFAQNPSGAVALVPESSIVDDCGRFQALNLPRATFGFLAIGIDDATGITPAEPHQLTSVIYTNNQATPAIGRAYATRSSSDAMWSSTAQLTGATFGQRGVVFRVFTYQGTPRSGVGIRRNAQPIPDDDYYFSDTGVARTTVAPALTATGANGAVLVLGSDTPVSHDGVGNEPSGCRWPSRLAASPPGVVAFEIVDAETTGGAPCP